MPTADITKFRFALKYNDSYRSSRSIAVIVASVTEYQQRNTHQCYPDARLMCPRHLCAIPKSIHTIYREGKIHVVTVTSKNSYQSFALDRRASFYY